MRPKPTTVELPCFNGLNPEAWVFQAERYFVFYSIYSAHQLSLASFYLDGEVLKWYRWLVRNKQLVDWPHFAKKLCQRFCKQNLEGPKGRLAKLRQQSIVAEYQARFEAISNEIGDISESWLAYFFVSGLRLEIKTAVLIYKPTTMSDVVELAHLHEQHIELEKALARTALSRT